MDGIDVSEFIEYLEFSQRTGYLPELHLNLKIIGRLLIKGSNKLTIQWDSYMRTVIYYKDPIIQMTEYSNGVDSASMPRNDFECILHVTKELAEINHETKYTG